MTKLSGSDIKLLSPLNWELWISTIQKHTRSNEVWDQINPSMEHRVPCIQAPIEPQISPINQEATNITDLSSDQLRLCEFMYYQYRSNL